MPIILRKATNDLTASLHKFPRWSYYAWHDLRARYRRTILGPFWLTLSTAVTVLGLGIVWSYIFHLNIKEFLPYVAAGMITWNFILSFITESGNVFIQNISIIRSIPSPYFVYVFQMVLRNIIIFFHNFIVFILVMIICDVPLTFATLLFIPSFLLLTGIGIWITMFLGILCTRYRDLSSIIVSITTLVFFVTPVFWKPEILKDHRYIADLNPLYHLLEVVRQPLLGNYPSTSNYIVTFAIFIGGGILSFLFLNKYRGRIAFWL